MQEAGVQHYPCLLYTSENYKRVAEAIGAEAGQIVTTDQTHTTTVLRVGKKQCGIGVTRKRPYTDVDGLLTLSLIHI